MLEHLSEIMHIAEPHLQGGLGNVELSLAENLFCLFDPRDVQKFNDRMPGLLAEKRG